MIEEVRRVVMGQPGPGTSEFTHAEAVEPMKLGNNWVWHVWGWDQMPELPHDPSGPYVARSWSPPFGGMRISATRFGRQSVATPAEQQTQAELQSLSDAEPCGRYADPNRPDMHRTDSFDFGVVVSGEVTVEAADGKSVVLRAGDVYIQNGSIHSWISNPDNPAHVVFISLGANRTG